MKKSGYILFTCLVLIFLFSFIVEKPVFSVGVCPGSQACYPIRVIDQWTCGTCSDPVKVCQYIAGSTCVRDKDCEDNYIGGGPCVWACSGSGESSSCDNYSFKATCDQGSCSWAGSLDNCQWSGGSCGEYTAPGSFGCCGPGSDPTPPPGGDSGGDSGDSGGDSGDGGITYHNVFGTVYDGDGSGLPCTGSGSPVQPGTSSQVASSFDLVSVDSDGTYPISPDTLLVPEGSNSITLVPDDPSWVCDCPTGCTYNIDVSADTQLNFFVTTTQNSWFQSIGGDLHANAALGQSIRNPVSVLCSGACEPYTTLLDDLGTSNSSGIVSYAGGTADFMSESGSQTFNIDEAGNDWLAQSLYRIPPTEDYAYFMRLFEMGLTPSEDFVTNPPTDASKPSGTPADGKAAFYRAGDLTINSSSWSVNSTESIVVFISGNLNIANNITVADGGFLAFIVQGNINFDSNLGSASPSNTVADVAGVYIASGTINTGSAGSGQDLKFVGEGIFVGWDGINLERDYRNDENNTAPAELFRYRPDFLFSAPDEFNRPLFHWQEVAP